MDGADTSPCWLPESSLRGDDAGDPERNNSNNASIFINLNDHSQPLIFSYLPHNTDSLLGTSSCIDQTVKCRMDLESLTRIR